MKAKLSNSGNADFMKEVISNLCGIVFIIDLKTMEYTWGNDRFTDILGYEEDEIFMNTLEFAEHYFHPDDKHIVKERIKFFRNRKNTEWSGVYRIKHKKGHWVWLYSRMRVFERDAEGKPKKLLGEVMDAFENIKTNKKIRLLFQDRVRNGNLDVISKLSGREVEVIYHITTGKTYTEIAEKLQISPETVNKHRKNILRKLKLKNVASLSTFASENGLV